MQSGARRRLVGLGIAGLAALSLPAFAQSERRVRRIGFLSASNIESTAEWLEAFRKGMAELGRVEGRDYAIDARYANADVQVVPRLAAELVAARPDLILTTADEAVRALSQRTKTIPIVSAFTADFVGNGFAASLRRPGGNITGLTNLARDLAAKRL